jgi:DNA-binding NarL/FixJ family response regulator
VKRIGSPTGDAMMRPREIVGLATEGKTNHQFAEELYTSYYTVVSHMRNVFEKTGVRSRFDLIRRGAHPGQRP